MGTIILEKIPHNIKFKTNKVDFEVFAEKFIEYIEYMEDINDIEKVKLEMNTSNESFNYDFIRGNYV